jgi:hypothetical protein
MRPKQVIDALVSLIPTQRPVYLWGPPGVGKSSLIHQAAKQLGLEVRDLRAVLLDPVDLRGLPVIGEVEYEYDLHTREAIGDFDPDDLDTPRPSKPVTRKVKAKTARWVAPEFFPRDPNSKGLIFLDELAQAPPMVQAACLQLTLDRRVGEYELPEGWAIVAASNRQEDRAGAHRLISPLLNRFIHLDLEVSNQDWQAWAANNGVHPMVRAFLEMKTDDLHKFDPSAGARAFPTPRSWEFVSQVLPKTPAELRHAVVAGCVGDGVAADFCGFLEYAEKLPKIGDILAKPSTYKVPEEPNICVALSGALSEACRDPKNHDAVATYATRMAPEYAALAMRMCTTVGGVAFTKAKAAGKWMTENYRLLTQVA